MIGLDATKRKHRNVSRPKLSGSALAAQLEQAIPVAPAVLPHTEKNKGGRPPKAGPDGIPVNVRLSAEDHNFCGDVATKIREPRRPVPTVQDVVRRLIKGARRDPDLFLQLVRDGA